MFERVAPREWRNRTLPPGAPLDIRDPAMTIPGDEIFGPEPDA